MSEERSLTNYPGRVGGVELPWSPTKYYTDIAIWFEINFFLDHSNFTSRWLLPKHFLPELFKRICLSPSFIYVSSCAMHSNGHSCRFQLLQRYVRHVVIINCQYWNLGLMWQVVWQFKEMFITKWRSLCFKCVKQWKCWLLLTQECGTLLCLICLTVLL